VTLEHWDISDKAANSSLQQINRQKSARNLFVQRFDRSSGRAVLYDPKRKQTHIATLKTCDCVDFQRLKQVVYPCMHIYRVAAELGLLTLDHMDRALAERIDAESRIAETERLQALPRDRTIWGNWSSEIHESFVQKNRQWRGYVDVYGVEGLVERSGSGWLINGWSASVSQCHCPDFDERKLPCKHIYAVAILSEIRLPLSKQHFDEIWSRGDELFFHAWGEVSSKRQDPNAILDRRQNNNCDVPERGIVVHVDFNH
jgi:SWIM zinc finger